MSYNAMDIAKYIINKCTTDQNPISNLQLQKILYYVQKTFLENGIVAFDDEIEAWQFGPVVPDVYYHYCGFGSMHIRMRYDTNICLEYRTIINPIVDNKRLLNPWNMVEDTHKQGKAWDYIYNNGLGNHHIIPKNIIKMKG
ncbi:MAG: DUF4065 domain-containing protein [Lachnospiraceae bacterium]|nr:DUF4065 domain-containing protein [Lachnospiraceae bacterium]